MPFPVYNNKMFLNNVDSKANKLKLNIDTYLNDKKKDNNYQQPIPSVSRPPQNTYPSAPLISIHPVPQTMNHIPNPTTSVNSQSVKPLELDIKSMVFQGKLY